MNHKITTLSDAPDEALGESEVFLDFQEKLSQVAAVDRPVLIIGERGTGKELAAKRLHFLSPRWDAPVVELNCAALSPTLIESELFGHESGAFTGATRLRRGRFELANSGTLFLDELGNIPMQVQEKILRAVEYGRFERVGGMDQIQVDVRVIGATNVNLKQRAEDGLFMQDLLDRLSFEVLKVPPLRERREDILLLARHFAARMSDELMRETVPAFSSHTANALLKHSWRGNIRELKYVVERAVYKTEGDVINELDFNPFAGLQPESAETKDLKVLPENNVDFSHSIDYSPGWKSSVSAYEIQILRQALQDNHFNQRATAEALQLSYNQFRGLYRKYNKEITDE